jgi:dephospho-CoA kinase
MKCLQIGLTGSIGMGKSVISNQFKLLGFPLFCADETVHKLYSNNGKAVKPISEIFPETLINTSIDRNLLSKIVLGSPDLLKKIEQIVHPLVVIERELFYKNACINNHFLVIYDIPLLYENITKHSDLDYVIVATANEEVQKQRVLNRQNMTIVKFESILSKQIPDNLKRQKANYIIRTDYSLNSFAATRSQIATIIESLIHKHPVEWTSWKNRSHSNPDSINVDNINCKIEENIVEKDNDINLIKSSNKSSSIKDLFDLVIFDLDDTLLPFKGPIMVANNAVDKFMESKMPLTKQKMKETNYKEVMLLIMKDIPHISHDYTELRREYLKHIISTHSIENEHIYIEESVEVIVYFPNMLL